MKKEKIQNLYKNKIKLLRKYNKFYFDKSDPIITDHEYDKLKKDIINLEKKYFIG